MIDARDIDLERDPVKISRELHSAMHDVLKFGGQTRDHVKHMLEGIYALPSISRGGRKKTELVTLAESLGKDAGWINESFARVGGFYVWKEGDFHVGESPVIPHNLAVLNGSIQARKSQLERLPTNLFVNGSVDLVGSSKLTTLHRYKTTTRGQSVVCVGGDVDTRDCPELVDPVGRGIYVGGEFSITASEKNRKLRDSLENWRGLNGIGGLLESGKE